MSIPNREAEIGDAVSQGMVWDGVEWMQGNYKTAVNNLAKKLGIAGTMNEMGREFHSVKEMEDTYYKTHDCISDDSDAETARIERWMNDNNYTLND